MNHAEQPVNENLIKIEKQRNIFNENCAKLQKLLDEVERAKKKPKADAETTKRLAALQTLMSSDKFMDELKSLEKNVEKCKEIINETWESGEAIKRSDRPTKTKKIINKI